MARTIICRRENKTERNSSACTSADSESRRKLESRAPNTETTVDVDVDNGRRDNVDENAPVFANKSRVSNKITRLAQKFSSSALIAETPQPQPQTLQLRQQRPQQRIRNQLNHRRCQQPTVDTADGSGDCRVKATVRLFEIDSNRASVGEGVQHATMLTNDSAGAQIPFRRRIGNRSDANANADTVRARVKNWKTTDGGASANAATRTPHQLKTPVPLCGNREKVEKPPAPWSSMGDRCERVRADGKRNCADATYSGGHSIAERRCVSMLVKDTQTYASFDVRSLKNRPLSVAQHFRLESALNDVNSPTSQQPTSRGICAVVTERSSLPSPSPSPSLAEPSPVSLSLSKNSSFLHRSKTLIVSQQNDDDDDDDNDDDTSGGQQQKLGSDSDLIDAASGEDVYGYSNIDELRLPCPSAAPSFSNSSSTSSTTTTTSILTIAAASTFSRNYKPAAEPSDRIGDGDDDGGDYNVYDTVLYSELRVAPRPFRDERYSNVAQIASDGDENARGNGDRDDECTSCSTEAAYEVVSPMSLVVADSDSNSDSSLEKANSLYETKETTLTPSFHRNRSQTSTSAAAITHTERRQRQRKLVESGEDAAADNYSAAAATRTTNSSTSVASDDWLDINEWESADEINPNRIAAVKKRRIRLNKLRKLKKKKFRSYQTRQKVSIRVGSASTIYIADKIRDQVRERRYDSHPKQVVNNADSDDDAFAYGLGSGNDCRSRSDKSSGSVTVLRSVLYLLPKYEAQEISTLFLDSDHQLDEASLYADDLIESKFRFEKESGNGNRGDDGGVVENFSEELCDDFDDTSSDENDYTTRKSHRSPCASRTARTRYPKEKMFISSVQSQNIYEFMKKAKKTVRKSWSSFNQQMRKSSLNADANNVSFPKKDDLAGAAGDSQWSENNVGAKFNNDRVGVGATPSSSGSVRWASFKTKLRPKYSTVSAANSSSIFYLNPEDLRFDKAATNETFRHGCAQVDARLGPDKSVIRRRRTTCLDLNLTRPRPSSPPPPPPPGSGIDKDKRRCSGEIRDLDRESQNQNQNQNQNVDRDRDRGRNDADAVATYAFHSPSSSSNSDLNLSSCSDLRLRFADEPLYQFYAESVVQRTTDASLMEPYSNESDGYEEIGSLTSRPSAMELITPSPNGHGQCRSLWCEVDEVKNSGFLEKLSIGRQKLQEAKFEVVTSEASYYKSLSVLDKIFVNDTRLRNENLVSKNDWKILFENVAAVRKCSQAFLSDLEKCWQEDIMLAGLSNVIFEHASTNFKIFVKYCSNQIYIDRTLKKLREESANFVELIGKLEADPVCQSLSLHSFLMLPMQRITRMPLLVDAILSKLDPIADQSDHRTFKTTLAKLNKIVKDCNENARKFERYEEMLLVSRQLEFSRKDVKMFSVASSSRWLVRSGPLMYLNPPDAKLTITRKLTKNAIKLYFFLFNDVLVIAKKKSEDSYAVVDYCLRNVLQISSLEDTSSSTSLANLYLPHRYLLLATILENHEGKTVEMVLSCDTDSTRQRWLEACGSRLASDNPEEKLYEQWDCPQVLAVHVYLANQPDELSLQNGDVVKVLKKTTDGWYHGERIRDGVIGWFPGNYTIEIASQHTRAKNLKLRHRLLTLSADYLQNQLQK